MRSSGSIGVKKVMNNSRFQRIDLPGTPNILVRYSLISYIILPTPKNMHHISYTPKQHLLKELLYLTPLSLQEFYPRNQLAFAHLNTRRAECGV